jgi:hypothetical protein
MMTMEITTIFKLPLALTSRDSSHCPESEIRSIGKEFPMAAEELTSQLQPLAIVDFVLLYLLISL